MKLVFCGTPQFAAPTLDRLLADGFDVQLVVTQPDRPKGRGMERAASPVKQSALRRELSIAQPDKIKHNAAFRAQLEAIAPEAIVVVGYGRIIPKWMLDLPKHGNINLHASLLPRYRGAAPIQWAIANGETVTGVTTMRINEGLDTGDLLLQEEMAIAPDDTSLTLTPRLAAMGAALTSETITRLHAGTIAAKPQDHSLATLAPILKKEDGLIDFARTAKQITDRLRGFQPWPGAFTTFRGKALTLHSVKPHGAQSDPLKPGETWIEDDHLLIGCGTGTLLQALELQLEGKKRMAAKDFINGYRPSAGELLGG